MKPIILIAILGVILYIIIKARFKALVATKTSKLIAHINNIQGFRPDHIVVDCHGEKAIAIDKSGMLLCAIAPGREEPTHNQVEFNNLIAVEVLLDKKTISKNSVEGAVVGGLLAGGIGALIGSHANKSNIQKISTITIKVNTNNLDLPMLKLDLFYSVKADGEDVYVESVQKALEEAEKWEGLLVAPMAQNKE